MNTELNLLPPKSFLSTLILRSETEGKDLRDQLQGCLDRISDSSEKNELVKRLTAESFEIFWPATSELWIAAECALRGCTIFLHPLMDNGTHPEFLAKHNNEDFILEVKSLLPPQVDLLEGSAFVYLQEKVPPTLGDAHVHVQVSPKSQLPGDFAISALPPKIASSYQSFLRGEGSRFAVDIRGTAIELSFHDLGEGTGTSVGWMKGGIIHEMDRIKEDIGKKANKYKATKLPFVVVIDSQDWFRISPEQVERALYGSRQVHFLVPQLGNDKPVKLNETRANDGFFVPHKNTRVSAVGYHIALWKNGKVEHTLKLYHNAFAAHPLNEGVFKGLPQFVVREDTPGSGHYEWIDDPRTMLRASS